MVFIANLTEGIMSSNSNAFINSSGVISMVSNPNNSIFQDLATFVEEADDGLIVFSMGFSMGINIPTHLFNSMMSALSKLPQRSVFKGSTAHATNESELEVRCFRFGINES